jgi:hypothetical protein
MLGTSSLIGCAEVHFSPEEAEAGAAKQGFGPLATVPDPLEFDPDEMPWWSLPMALAWIKQRTREPSLRTRRRNPSCFISCTHGGPDGGRTALDGLQGSTKPKGRSVRIPN